jgi:hypothetical protein
VWHYALGGTVHLSVVVAPAKRCEAWLQIALFYKMICLAGVD